MARDQGKYLVNLLNILVVTLSALALSSLSNAQTPTLFKNIPSQMRCQAARLIQGDQLPAGEIQIRIDPNGELQIEGSFPADKTNDFKFGRRITAGQDLTNKPDYKCRYFFN